MALKFNTDTGKAHKHGLVSYSSIPSAINGNASRVNSAFNQHANRITRSNINSLFLAKKMFSGKNEFNFEDDFETDNSGEILRLRTELDTANREVENIVQGVDESQEDFEIRSAQLNAAAEEKKSELDQVSALIDTTRAVDAVSTEAIDDPSGVYNPDFPINSISFTYSRDISGVNGANDRSGTSIHSTRRGPNIGHPNGNTTNNLTNPATSQGGFGNSNTEGTVQDSYLDSIQITRKYED
tara:strand:- start:568 stop:1290 length:723 start_codon:yes stop_codon:yes gene_type:complete